MNITSTIHCELSQINTTQGEFWKPVVGYESVYEVSNLGNVRRVRMGIGTKSNILMLKPMRKQNGYMQVFLRDCGRDHLCHVHRLVAIAFLPNPQRLPEVNHIDSNRSNNILVNLEWVSRKMNMQHASFYGRTIKGSNHHFSKLVESDVIDIRKLLLQGVNPKHIANRYGVSQGAIGAIAIRKTWKHVAAELNPE